MRNFLFKPTTLAFTAFVAACLMRTSTAAANDYQAVIDNLAAENYSLLDAHAPLVRLFHNDFLEIYSDYCGEELIGTVTREVPSIESEMAKWGFETGDIEIEPTREILLEKPYAEYFDEFEDQNRLYISNRIADQVSKDHAAGRDAGRSAKLAAGSFIRNYNKLIFLIRDNCSQERVRRIYRNLLTYAPRIPAAEDYGNLPPELVEGTQKTPSGLRYAILKQGAGIFPAASDTVTVHYRGTLLNGQEFDSSYRRGEPTSFPLNGVIRGWTEGLQLIQPGGKIKLIIPPELAYGAQGFGPIGPNATLVFEIELLAVK